MRDQGITQLEGTGGADKRRFSHFVAENRINNRKGIPKTEKYLLVEVNRTAEFMQALLFR